MTDASRAGNAINRWNDPPARFTVERVTLPRRPNDPRWIVLDSAGAVVAGTFLSREVAYRTRNRLERDNT